MKPTIRYVIAFALAIVLSPRLFGATGTISPSPFLLVLTNNGLPASLACVWTYTAGTSTPVATYTDVALSVANANPIIASTAGRFTAFLTPGVSYKFIYELAPCSSISHGTQILTADNISAMPGSSAGVDVLGTAGETFTAGQAAYLSDGSGSKTAGSWYKGDSTNGYSSTMPEVGIAVAAITSGNTGTFRLSGSVTGLTSLSVGAEYFVGAAGALTSTAPANARHVGHADTATTLVLTANPPSGASTQAANKVFAGPSSGSAAAPTFRLLTGADLAAPAACRVLDRKVTSTDVVSSLAETVVYTFSVPANTLSTTKALYVSLIGDYLNNSGGTVNLTVKVKYGATTFVTTGLISQVTGANRAGIFLDAALRAANLTNAQVAYGHLLSMGRTVATNTGVMQAPPVDLWSTHTSVAEDSTGALTFQITAQHDTSAATISFREYEVLLLLCE